MTRRLYPWQEVGAEEDFFDRNDEHHTAPHRVELLATPDGREEEEPVPEAKRSVRARSGGPRRRVVMADERRELRAAIERAEAGAPKPRKKEEIMAADAKKAARARKAAAKIIKGERKRPAARKGRRKKPAVSGPFVDFDALAAQEGFEEVVQDAVDEDEEDDE